MEAGELVYSLDREYQLGPTIYLKSANVMQNFDIALVRTNQRRAAIDSASTLYRRSSGFLEPPRNTFYHNMTYNWRFPHPRTSERAAVVRMRVTVEGLPRFSLPDLGR